MKRIFTYATIALIAVLAFAQVPEAKKTVARTIEQVLSSMELTQKANEAQELRAAMAEKEAAAAESSTSVFRIKGAHSYAAEYPSVKGAQIIGVAVSSRECMIPVSNNASGMRRTTAQEGNLSITTDDHGIITDVTGVEAKYYVRSASGVAYYASGQSMYQTAQSGVVTIIEDGENVYIKNPVTRYTSGAWVKGTKSEGAITVATHQPVAYNTQYGTTLSLRWAQINPADGTIAAADDIADVFTFTIDGNVLTLEGTAIFNDEATEHCPFMAILWDDDDSASGYGDVATVLTYDADYVPPTTDLVVLPEGAVTEDWYFNGTQISSQSEKAIKNQPVKVAFVGSDVYVQGFSIACPEGWVKGSIDGATATFAKFQYVGEDDGDPVWLIGYDADAEEITNATAAYDAAAKTFTFDVEVLFNCAPDRIYYLEWFTDVVISANEKEFVEPTINTLTAELPYANTFETTEEQEQVGIYDANEDQKTFVFYNDVEANNISARISYNSSMDMDDYLVFPGVELEAGKSYKVTVDSRCYSATYPEVFEVLAGKEAKASKFNITVIEPQTVADKEYSTFANGNFKVEESGTYFFTVHGISNANMWHLFIDNFKVSENNPNAISAVTDLTITPDAGAANKATVKFTMPTTNISDGTLTDAALKATLTRNGDEVTLPADGVAAPGAEFEFVDEVPTPGTYKYEISVTDAEGGNASESAFTSAYIGEDTPKGVTGITAADKTTKVALSWNAPTEGATGGVILPENIVYNIYPVELTEFFGMVIPIIDYNNPFQTGITDTEAEIEYDTCTGDPAFTYFAVTAENTAGESTGYTTALVTGLPYEMPVKESGADKTLVNWWGLSTDAVNGQDSNAGVFFISDKSSDGDGYCFGMVANAPGYITFESAKVNLAGTANPVVSFDYASEAAGTLKVIVESAQGEKEVASIETGTEFAAKTISLLEFAAEPWIRVIFYGEYEEANIIYIDNIKIVNLLDHNLSAKGIAAPAKVKPGNEYNVTVDIENQGALAAAGYSVELYLNGELAKTIEGEALEPDAKATVTFAQTATALSPATMEYSAKINYAADQDLSDNTTEAKTTILNIPNYPTATNLIAEEANGVIALAWNEPDMEAAGGEVITDDFESYEPFAVDEAGDWTFVDEDGCVIGGAQQTQFGDVQPGETKAAYFVMNLEEATPSLVENPTFAAHSGIQYMVSSFLYNAAQDGANADWMISPVLSGTAQTISFWAKSYSSDYAETFKVFYSTTDKNIESFTQIATVENVPQDWTEYNYNLPEGAKYFAIKNVSNDKFFLFVDDVTYEAGSVSAELDLVGYNVYRDGEIINAEPVADTEYVDAEAEKGAHTYVVTTVYEQGESKPSNEAAVTLSIGSIANDALKIEGDIYSIDGKLIRKDAKDLNGLSKGVYLIGGQKVFVK